MDIFLAGHVAADFEGAVNSGAQGHSVGLGKKNFMSANKVVWNVVEVGYVDGSHGPLEKAQYSLGKARYQPREFLLGMSQYLCCAGWPERQGLPN